MYKSEVKLRVRYAETDQMVIAIMEIMLSTLKWQESNL